ncbi:MAG TPA: rhodanese-like domain-containing protein [Tepidisphaeraceae bacterium]|jgi:rhodanese-related sulfurtransferase|nr:rhodanese-like domain-containing protein [Tepidisphaeraceae bacterium]
MTVQTIDSAEVFARQSHEAVDVIDVRTPGEFEAVHMVGARNLPLDRLDPSSLVAPRGEHTDRPIYVICRSGARAAKAAERFASAGFANVMSVRGGTDAWVRAGLPVERGACKVISLERQVRLAAGTLVLVGVLLGWFVHPLLFGLAAFVGAGLIFAGVTDWCGMGMLLARMPWNRAK